MTPPLVLENFMSVNVFGYFHWQGRLSRRVQVLHAWPPPMVKASVGAADEVREPLAEGLVSNEHPFPCMKPCRLCKAR